jgi:hypothetical protein
VTKYEHTQTGSWIIYAIGLPALILLAMAAFSSAIRPELFLPFVLLLCVLLFWRLTIKIDSEALQASFGIGLIRKTVRVANIVACEPIRVRWWWGWGIHFTPYGWLYNVSGWDAVAITLRDGKRFCVGTDEPQELQAAIRRFASVR